MNTIKTIFPNIGNRNTSCHDVGNDDASRMSSQVSKVTSETAQQKGISFIPQDSRLGDEHNVIHRNQNKRTVDLNGAETYLIPSDRNGVVCHESIDSNNDTENLLGF